MLSLLDELCSYRTNKKGRPELLKPVLDFIQENLNNMLNNDNADFRVKDALLLCLCSL